MGRMWLLGGVLVLALPLAAQEFHPPPAPRGGSRGTRLGLFGFGVRGGLDLSGGQLVVGATLDAGDLFSDRLRLRPSGEIGFSNGTNTYLGSLEALYRFTADDRAVTPYSGAGLGVAGHDRCGTDPRCPGIWFNLVLGFELHYRSTFNWLLEYHALRGFGENRVYVGLTTRRGT